MTNENCEDTSIEILGKTYKIKCSQNDIESLQRAAAFLVEKMDNMRTVGKVLSIDRIAVITALNIAHQLLALENQETQQAHNMQQRIRDLHAKVETALAKRAQLEFEPAE